MAAGSPPASLSAAPEAAPSSSAHAAPRPRSPPPPGLVLRTNCRVGPRPRRPRPRLGSEARLAAAAAPRGGGAAAAASEPGFPRPGGRRALRSVPPAEQDPISRKGVRGGDGGLGGSGGAGVQRGGPEDKGRRTDARRLLSLPPACAPPPGPDPARLGAADPLDDGCTTTSRKPPPSSSPSLGPGSPGFGGHSTFGVPPRGPPRMSSPHCAPPSLGNQPHPLPQTPSRMGFNRTLGHTVIQVLETHLIIMH